MRIILKLLAAPFVLALTLLVAVLNFAFSFASWVFCALSFLCLIGALFALFTGDRWGIQGLVIAFAVSPFGLPAVAEWLIDKLDSLNYSLKSFITGAVFFWKEVCSRLQLISGPTRWRLGKALSRQWRNALTMGLIRKSWEPCPHTSAIRPRLPLSFCW